MATAIRNGQVDRGIIVCGSGAGVSVAANKFPGIRAAVCHDAYTARQAVEHDDLNVLCLGARVIGPAVAKLLTETFIAAVVEHYRALVGQWNATPFGQPMELRFAI